MPVQALTRGAIFACASAAASGRSRHELGQLPEDGEIAGAWPFWPIRPRGNEPQEFLEGFQEAAVLFGLDHRAGHRVGADVAQPADLALGERPWRRPGPAGLVQAGCVAPPVGQGRRGLGDVGRIGPAVVEHRLGQPLVGVVLDQLVQERQRRIGGDQAAPGVGLLEALDERRGVGDRLQLAAQVRQVEGRQQRDLGARQIPQGGVVGQHEAVGDAAVAQHGQHLAGVGRSRRAGEGDGVIRCISGSSAAPVWGWRQRKLASRSVRVISCDPAGRLRKSPSWPTRRVPWKMSRDLPSQGPSSACTGSGGMMWVKSR